MKRNRMNSCILLLTFLAGIHSGRVAIWQGEDPDREHVEIFPPFCQCGFEDVAIMLLKAVKGGSHAP